MRDYSGGAGPSGGSWAVTAGWGIPARSLGRFQPQLLPPSLQKPILLQGHERSITQIKYNREGDLLFTVAKDPVSAA